MSPEQAVMFKAARQCATAMQYYERRRLQTNLTYMLAKGFSEQDLHQMLRGQLLCEEGAPRPCNGNANFNEEDDLDESDLDEDKNAAYLWRIRRRFPLRTEPHPEPAQVATPPARLGCPLTLRARSGAKDLPCAWLQRVTLMVVPSVPCTDVLGFAKIALQNMLLQPERTESVPEPPAAAAAVPLLARRDEFVLRAQRHEREEEELALAALRYLIDSKRLSLFDLEDLLESQVLVTEAGWLPCRHDPLRTVWPTPEAEEKGGAARYLPPIRRRCPLELKARLGDSTVACCEALGMAPDEERIAGQKLYLKTLARDRAEEESQGRGSTERRWDASIKVRTLADLPVTWQRKEEQPGGPEDPVIRMKLRPCHLVGQLLMRRLYKEIQDEVRIPLPELETVGYEGNDEEDEGDEDEGDEGDEDEGDEG